MSEPANVPGSTAPSELRRAVVIGGGLAGLLAAAALRPYADVTVVERDTLPRGPRTATGRPLVFHAFLGVITLSKPLTALLTPEVLLAVVRGPLKSPLTGPPLTEGERAAVFEEP